MFTKDKVLVCLLAVFFVIAGQVFSQTDTAGLYSGGDFRSAEEGFAAQEFRRGVQAFYRGSFNESVLQFEKALNYMPDDNLIMYWLGKAYYHSGLEGTAIRNWSRAVENGYGGLLLQNKIEIIGERRISWQEESAKVRYTEAGSFSGIYNGIQIFSGPISALPNNNGTVWVLAYGSNELVEININGMVVSRVTGPLNGFDRPMDIIRIADGTMLVSESAGDRIAHLSKRGKFISYIGKKGRGVGEMVGPQFLAQDSRQNIYVSDYGNSRIDVFDKDGNGLFYFGGSQKNFDGLKGPTGIAALGESIFVCDDIKDCIYEFDQAGNFKRILCEEKSFNKPESLKVWGSYLVLCDSNKVITIDPESGALFENVRTGNAPSRLTSAVPDVNGNVIVTDVRSNEVYVMSKMQELVGGLFVQIERVNASKFPEVTVDLRVENRHRNPVVGLKENNFYITEQKRPVSNMKFIGASSENSQCDITIIVDRSNYSKSYEEQINTVVREIVDSMKNRGRLRILSAGKVPAVEYVGTPSGAKQFNVNGLKTPYSDNVPLDLALRLAANDLINADRKRAVIMVSTGKTGLAAFSRYSLAETAAYLNNNHIYVSSVLVSQAAADEEFSYIVDSTPGTEYYMFRPEGLGSIVDDLIDIPSGLYTFSYTSVLSTNFGEKFLPVEVETYLLNRSGRDESGYFAPLQ
ncbi:MAG: hypothetical protein IJL70_09585 [Treponema sp.]|nr:hypothetical protein [Treponema sp.]